MGDIYPIPATYLPDEISPGYCPLMPEGAAQTISRIVFSVALQGSFGVVVQTPG